MAATTLPRTVRIAVIALACILWPLSAWTAWAWDVRSLILTLALASVSTVAWGFIYLADKIDEMASSQRERTHERQLALISVIEQMSCGPVTDPQGMPQLSVLRDVS